MFESVGVLREEIESLRGRSSTSFASVAEDDERIGSPNEGT